MCKKVAVVMGSDSDLEVMKPCIQRLKSFEIPVEVRVISAHRTPAAAEQFASAARANGFGAVIAAAGKAAHLAGVIAAYTTLPVIGVPIQTSMMGGLDSLLSMVQMPKGIPVACVAVDGADNAAILAAQMLALSDEALVNKLTAFKAQMADEVSQKDQNMQMEEFKMAYEKKEQLYEGKAKKVFATGDPEVVIVSYKDDATAFNGLKKGTITGKGAINNRMTNNLMRRLEAQGVPTHYVEELSDRETAVKKVSIVPLEVIIRNISAGSFAKRYGVEEGIVFDEPTIEFSYKNDDLGDPLLNTYHALALKLATQQEIDLIKKYAFMVNDLLKGFMKEIGIDLVDFKLEFGKTSDGAIVLADEISPDTCRLWDETTHEKLDKDRFRRDLGGAEEAYEEVMRRLMGDR